MNHKMNILEAIATRRSRRTYSQQVLTHADTTYLSSECRRLSEAPAYCHALDEAKLPKIILQCNAVTSAKLGTYGIIKGATNFFIMASGESESDKILAGMRMESLLLACTGLGLSTCWLGGTYSKSAFQEAYDRINRTQTGNYTYPEAVSIVVPVGYGTEEPRFTEKIMRRLCQADMRKSFSQLFEGVASPTPQLMSQLISGTTLPSDVTTEDAVAVALECVRLAPSSTNSQPWRAEANRDIKGHLTGITFRCATNNRLSAFDMGIAYCHFIKALRFFGIVFDMEIERPTDLPGAFFKIRKNNNTV